MNLTNLANSWKTVVGTLADTFTSPTLYGRVMSIYNYTLLESEVYPTLATGATVVTATADWTYGNYAVVVPAGTIAVAFKIHAVIVETCNEDGVFQLQLYKGAGSTVVATVRFAVDNGFFGNAYYVTGSALVEAGSQVRARAASSDGALNPATMTISIAYVRQV